MESSVAEYYNNVNNNGGSSSQSQTSTCMQKFRLYETQSNFYMIGRNKSRIYWRVLKIDRLDPFELNIREDSTTYTEFECSELLRRIHEGNKSTGGLKFVTACYGIVGFIKFLGPYYMLLITKRRRIGAIFGHNVYAVSKSEMIPLPNSSVNPSIADFRKENRYKKLLSSVDLTKDFFFSYSYNVMCSLQKNLYNNEPGEVLYETMFVWNEFLTRGIRNHLKNTLWTVALVYGFFKQASFSVSGRSFKLMLIARRSRHYEPTKRCRASDFPREYDGECLQMRMSYSPAAHLFLFLVQWTDCHLAGALGLLRILIYKVYVDGTTTMSTHERKASIREFYDCFDS